MRETPREGPKVPLKQTVREGTQEPVRQAAREGTPNYPNIQQPGVGPKHPDEVITLMKKNTRKKRRMGTFFSTLEEERQHWDDVEEHMTNQKGSKTWVMTSTIEKEVSWVSF